MIFSSKPWHRCGWWRLLSIAVNVGRERDSRQCSVDRLLLLHPGQDVHGAVGEDEGWEVLKALLWWSEPERSNRDLWRSHWSEICFLLGSSHLEWSRWKWWISLMEIIKRLMMWSLVQAKCHNSIIFYSCSFSFKRIVFLAIFHDDTDFGQRDDDYFMSPGASNS